MSARSRTPYVLVVDDELYYREIVSFVLEAEFQAQITAVSSVTEAIGLLQSGESLPDLILCDDETIGGRADDLLRFLAQAAIQVPFFLLASGGGAGNPPGVQARIQKPHELAKLVELVQAQLRVGRPDFAPEYCRVKVSTLLQLGLLYQDLYIRLGEDRYVRVMRTGDPFDDADSKRFQHKQVEYLYIRRTDVKSFLAVYLKNLAPLAAARELSTEASLSITESTVHLMRDLSQAFGWTPELQRIARENVALAVKSLGQNPNLLATAGRLQQGGRDAEEYFATHTVQLAFVACGIAQALNWSSEVTFYKLTLASVLHDMTLEDRLLSRESELLEDLEREKARGHRHDPDLATFAEHPLHAAEIVRDWPDLPPDVDTIIVQHHERPDGRGFPHQLSSARIHPLSAILIVAEDLVHFRMDSKERSCVEFLNERNELYSHGPFKKIHQALTMSLGVSSEEKAR